MTHAAPDATASSPPVDTPESLARERWLIGVLTAINVTHILDFVVMNPLAPQLMRQFQITTAQFTVGLSAYTFAAAIASFAGALVIDRWERRRVLLWLYGGFIVSTVACALAGSFPMLVAARCAAGICGGMLGSLVNTIVAENVPYARRGAAMGRVVSAFSVASVLGIPAGVWLAAVAGWHATFLAVAAASLPIAFVATRVLPEMRGHLQGSPRSPWGTCRDLLRVPMHGLILLFSGVMTFAGFLVIPLIAIFLARNLGVAEAALGLVYLCGGLVGLVSSPWIGRLADRHGKHRTFLILAGLSLMPTLALTHLTTTSLPVILLVTTGFIVIGGGRFIPASALISEAMAPAHRGGVLSLQSGVHSAAIGLAALTGGLLVHQAGPLAPLEGFGLVGWVACAVVLAGAALSLTVKARHEPAQVV